jgi:hypothetical protein
VELSQPLRLGEQDVSPSYVLCTAECECLYQTLEPAEMYLLLDEYAVFVTQPHDQQLDLGRCASAMLMERPPNVAPTKPRASGYIDRLCDDRPWVALRA